ncbi:hypothetical protein HC931_11140 [Candidatus Gracilibacteria bacterium]|nr:hypothetical protein [Candidatus Gracilibacteria bacterium]
MAENNSNSFSGDFPDLVYFPPFAGGGTPAFVGDDTPDIEGGTANKNQTNGNGNWYFSSDNTTEGNGNWYIGNGNTTTGNGNWNFGSGNTTKGNGNWYIGDDNITTGNGNRPSGSNNDITGNGNRPSGDGNVITGNRHETDEDNQNIVGNSDRYFSIDSNGNMTLVSDGTSNGDRSEDRTTLEASSVTTNSNGGETMNEEELNDLLRDSPFGRLLDIPGVEGAEDIFGNLGGGNPFGGGGMPGWGLEKAATTLSAVAAECLVVILGRVGTLPKTAILSIPMTILRVTMEIALLQAVKVFRFLAKKLALSLEKAVTSSEMARVIGISVRMMSSEMAIHLWVQVQTALLMLILSLVKKIHLVLLPMAA